MLGDCGTPIVSGTRKNSERVDSDESGDSVSIKKPKMAHSDSLSDSLSIKESQGGHCSSPKRSVNIKENTSDNSERPCDRQHDSFEVPKLAQISSGPSSPVQSTVISEQMSFPPRGMQLFNKDVPPYSEQVNIYINC